LGTNIADHLITCINYDETEEEESKKRIVFFIEKWDEEIAQKKEQKIVVHDTKKDASRTRSTVNGIKAPGATPGFGMQFWELLKRDLIELKRNPALTRVKLVQSLFSSTFASCIFFQLDQTWPEGLGNISGALFFCMLSMTMMLTANTVLTFPLSRAIFERERRNKMYMTTPFFISKWTVSILELFFALPYSLITKYMMGLKIPFFTHFLFLMSFCFVAGGMGTTVGAIAPDAQSAVQLLPLTIVPFVMMAGFLVSLDSITWALRWIAYIDLFKYGFEGMTVHEMMDNWYDCQDTKQIVNGVETTVSLCPQYSPEYDYIRCGKGVTVGPNCMPREYSGTYYVSEGLGMDIDARWTNLFILLCLGIGFRLLGYGVLVRNNGW